MTNPKRINASIPATIPESLSAKELKKRQSRARKKLARMNAKEPVKDNDNKGKDKDKDKSKDVNKEKEAEKATPEATPDPTPTTAPAQPAKLQLPEVLAKAIPRLMPEAIKDLLDSLAKEIVPSERELPSPEEAVAKLLDAKGPIAKASKLDEQTTHIAQLKSGLEKLKDGGDIMEDARACLRAKLATAEAAFAKLAKETPSQDYERKALVEFKSKYETGSQARKDNEARGQAKSAERKIFREACIQSLKDQVALLEAGITTLEAENDAKYAERTKAQEAQDAGVLKLLDAKIAAAKTQAPQPQTPTAAAAGSGQVGSMAEWESLRKQCADHATIQAKYEELTNAVQAQFNVHYEDATSLIPSETNPNAKYMPTLGAMYRALQRWMMSGANYPFDWTDFKPVIGEELKASDIAKELLGRAWHKWYKGGTPAETDIIPKQVVLLVLHRLGQIKSVFEADLEEENEAKAQRSYDSMRDASKRPRA